jgi:hypothetical protein
MYFDQKHLHHKVPTLTGPGHLFQIKFSIKMLSILHENKQINKVLAKQNQGPSNLDAYGHWSLLGLSMLRASKVQNAKID